MQRTPACAHRPRALAGRREGPRGRTIVEERLSRDGVCGSAFPSRVPAPPRSSTSRWFIAARDRPVTTLPVRAPPRAP